MFVLIITVSLVSVLTQRVVGLSNFLDVDFYKGYDEDKCGNGTEWQIVNYEAIKVIPFDENTFNVRQATGNSCASSFPMIFSPGGVLEVSVYVQASSENSGIEVILFDEDLKVPVASYGYNKTSKEFTAGWHNLMLPIEIQTTGYINLLGSSESSDVILVDFIRYTSNISKTLQKNDATSKPVTNNSDNKKVAVEKKWFDTADDELDFSSGSGDGDDDDDDDEEGSGDPDEEPVIDEPTEGFWTPVTVAIIAFASVIGLILIAIFIYCLVKNDTYSDNLPLILDDVETPKGIHLVRVRNLTYDSKRND